MELIDFKLPELLSGIYCNHLAKAEKKPLLRSDIGPWVKDCSAKGNADCSDY